VYKAVRECKTKYGNWEKLHQFLSPSGVAVFESHMNTLLPLMSGCSSLEELRRILQQAITGTHQLGLLE
ncbi:MAG: hypothetical protein AAFY15_07465, partial [Cyanobacteria bacterium J06648_11]